MFDSIRLQADPVLSVAAALLFAVVLFLFAGLAIRELVVNRLVAPTRKPP